MRGCPFDIEAASAKERELVGSVRLIRRAGLIPRSLLRDLLLRDLLLRDLAKDAGC